MKESMKRITAAVCAAAMALMIGVVSVSASETARPQPDGSGTTTATDTMNTSSGEAGETAPETAEAQNNTIVNNASTVTQNTSSGSSERRYQTKLGGFLWFLLSVVVNFIISCWVGNRFYRLARRSTQSSAEIRALRKDIEEKFASTLRDISEPALEVMNQNENYARSDEGLGMPDRKNKIEINDEEREIFRRWDEQRANSRSARTAAAREDEYEDYENEDEYRTGSSERRTAYQPTRRSSGIEFDDEDQDQDYDYDDYEDYEEARSSSRQRPARMNERRETGSSKKSGINKAKGKARDFLSNVFPFED